MVLTYDAYSETIEEKTN